MGDENYNSMWIISIGFMLLIIIAIQPYTIIGSTTGKVVACNYDSFIWETTRITFASYGGATTEMMFWGDQTEAFEIGETYKIFWIRETWKMGFATITEIELL